MNRSSGFTICYYVQLELLRYILCTVWLFIIYLKFRTIDRMLETNSTLVDVHASTCVCLCSYAHMCSFVFLC